MKTTQFRHIIIAMILVFTCLFTSSCNFDVVQGNKAVPLSAPTNVRVEGTTLKWNYVENAIGYTVKIVKGANLDINSSVGEEIPLEGMATTSYSLEALSSGDYTIGVRARGNSLTYSSSVFVGIQFNRNVSIGGEYGDGSIRKPFGEFDDINTKNSFLGYGLDIINASSISSKNILMTYPIFDMDKLQKETLLYDNGHNNSFVAIEGETIAEFMDSMSRSSSINAGASVSAKGNVYGADVGGSVSMSGGLSTAFTKTSSSVQHQYFLEIISENQSYWLILQSSEERYKEILSDEFKKDLYSDMEPALLFEKYGTHLLTSVAMGGSISMYYTLYSYSESITTKEFAEVSSEIKTNVNAAYGSYSGSVGTETSFSDAFTYSQTAKKYEIFIDERIFCSGGGSYGINNSSTLYDHYFDWQNSLDLYPVVIGIKDTNSLYPIWNLIDMNVEGAEERYTELYNYFLDYGMDSLNDLYETYSITPAVAPDGITNIKLNGSTYEKGTFAQTKAGDTVRITFDVTPDNANKYKKLYTIYSDKDTDTFKAATIDENGVMTVSPQVKSGAYITVLITAGSVTEQVTFYVINSYNVNFNTRVAGLEVAPIIGVLEGYSIEAPKVSREGWILDGWFKDAEMTQPFDFETDSIYDHTTLYAKWSAIKPTVTFETFGGSQVNSLTVAYKGSISKPKTPTKNGYTFGGWYIDDDCTVEYDFSTALIENITLYAKWNKIEFTVTFQTNGGTPVEPIATNIEKGYLIEEPTTEKALHYFKGWYTDNNLTKPFYFGSQITEDITLYAKWEEMTFTITYYVDGEKYNTNEYKYYFGETINYLAWPSKEGKEFSGWIWTGGDLPDTMPAENMILEGTFDQVLFNVKYFVDGKQVTTANVYRGHSIPENENLKEKIGYTFSGWYTKDGEAKPESMPDADIELYGTFEVNTYTITFLDCDIAPITAAYGSSIIKPADPKWTGYTFTGWDKAIPDTMPAEDMVITAIKKNNKYSVTYDLNGSGLKGTFSVNGQINQVTYDVTSVINNAQASYSEYYQFDGWYTAKDGGVLVAHPTGQLVKGVAGYTDSDGKWIYDGNVTLYAHWSQTYVGYTYITSPSEFQKISQYGNYILLEDLDMSDIKWAPIPVFSGTLNGNNKKISNISMGYSGMVSVNSEMCRGIFGSVSDTAIIYDLNIYGISVYWDPQHEGNAWLYMGALAGKVYGTITNVQADNCSVTGHRDASKCGIIAGCIQGNISNCTVMNSELFTNGDGGIIAGDVTYGSISDCKIADCSISYYAVTHNRSCGGIVGYVYQGEVINCQVKNTAFILSGSGSDLHNYNWLGYHSYCKLKPAMGYIVGLNEHGNVHPSTHSQSNNTIRVNSEGDEYYIGTDKSTSESEYWFKENGGKVGHNV